MFVYYLVISLLIGAATMLNRNRAVRIVLLMMFLAVQTTMTFYAYYHLNEENSGYFKFDALGVIFLCVLTILSYTTIYHSCVYLQHRKDSVYSQGVYFAALIILIVVM